jgi:regulator of sigma E protease
MEDILIKTAQFVLSISILVILHELGHFIPARLFKTKVEKFYLFFDPWFSIFKFKKGDTEYGIGWLPLGGYVKIAGMIDESMDKEQMNNPPQSWEFRAKPAWQRLIIMLGGVTVNFILAMVIYAAVLFTWGESYLPNSALKDGIWIQDSIAYEMGLRNGDKILTINDKSPERFTEIMPEMIYGGTLQVQRSGRDTTIVIPENFIERLIDQKSKLLFMYRIPFVIADFAEDSPNKSSGLEVKDRVLAINGQHYTYFDEYKVALAALAGKEAVLTVDREGVERDVNVTISEQGMIGVAPHFFTLPELEKMGIYSLETREFGLLESVPAGVGLAWDKVSGYLRQLQLIFNPSTGAYKGLGGFATIGNLFPPVWDWQIFWEMTAFLSIMLGVLNLLPIPALDGGHAMFTTIEIITRRKPSQKFLEYAQMAGMILLLALVVYANGNDLLRIFGN